MKPLTLSPADLATVKAYTETLCGALKLQANSAESPLARRGVIRKVLEKHKAGLYDLNSPSCLTPILNNRAYKEERSTILMYYSLHGLPTHLVISRSGIFEKFPLCRDNGVFLEDNIRDETYVFSDEVDALIGSSVNLSAVCVTAPEVLLSYNTKVIVVDSPEKPLPVTQALSYYQKFKDVKFSSIPGSAASLRARGLVAECRDNRTDFLPWVSKAIVRSYERSVAVITADLEDCGMSDEIRDAIITQLKADKVDPFIVEWFNGLDLSARSIYINGSRIIQNRGGWRVAGDDRMLADFQLVVNKTKTIKRVKMAECTILTHDNKEYGFDIPVMKLGTQKSLDIYVHAHLRDLGVGPDIFSNNITVPNVNWMHIAHKFNPYTHVLQDTSSLGFEDFAALYNDIFTYTKFKRPDTQHKCGKDTMILGYWHHETGDLHIHKGRLLKAMRELTAKKLTAADIDRCFSDAVQRLNKHKTIYLVFPVHMIDSTPEGVIKFKLA